MEVPSAGTLPISLAMDGTIAIVPANLKGSVNFVITHAIANVPTTIMNSKNMSQAVNHEVNYSAGIWRIMEYCGKFHIMILVSNLESLS